MDDNENILDYQKMNFAQFSSQFTNINQFSPSKFSQNITTANGQVVGLVSGTDGNVHYVRPVDNGSFSQSAGNTGINSISGQIQQQSLCEQQQSHQALHQPQALITLPITVPGAKIGDAQQTVHIQVINPNPIPINQPQQQKFQMGQMQIPIQTFQPGGTTVLTVAYSPQDGKFLPNHGFPEGMTVVAAIQPQDLQLLAQAQAAQQIVNNNILQQQQQLFEHKNDDKQHETNEITVKEEPTDWDSVNNIGQSTQPDLSEFITTHSQVGNIPMTLTPYLKFNPDAIKFETPDFTVDDNSSMVTQQHPIDQNIMNNSIINSDDVSPLENNENGNAKTKRKRRVKKPKLPKPKPPKPGQVLIATAIDGTVLFCCPECQMAYPEKENLEQHLSVHKIERRYICDICGAGLKRKEHLERHKSGHNPDRPYICSVCMKGFKRKEHLNLHFVIHSGEKNEICGECGKGFYRKDHLRKHTNSHIAKRIKERIKEEEMNSRDGSKTTKKNKANNNNNNSNKNNNSNSSLDNSLNNSSTLEINNSNILMHQANDSSLAQQQLQNNQEQDFKIEIQQPNSNSDNTLNTISANNAINININDNNNIENHSGNLVTNTQPAISLSTVYVPTSDNTSVPVQIQIPQIITTSSPDGTIQTSTIVMPQSTENQSHSLMTTSS